MNTLIKKELDSVKSIKLSEYNEDTLEINIPKNIPKDKKVSTFEEKHSYKIKLKEYIVHPYEGFNLHIQWNKNVIPQEYVYDVEILRVMGKMINVSGLGCENNTSWTGWLPISSVEILEVL